MRVDANPITLKICLTGISEPPASLYSRIDHHSLVPLDRFEFPPFPM
jgi:hypothetical protein